LPYAQYSLVAVRLPNLRFLRALRF